MSLLLMRKGFRQPGTLALNCIYLKRNHKHSFDKHGLFSQIYRSDTCTTERGVNIECVVQSLCPGKARTGSMHAYTCKRRIAY